MPSATSYARERDLGRMITSNNQSDDCDALLGGGKIFVAGHKGLVGAAIMRRLNAAGLTNLVTKTRAELDLRNQASTTTFFLDERPDYVILAAAKVGGIMANNTYPADFIRDNLLMQTNVIDAAYRAGVKKLLFLGSSCIYPKFAPQPMREEYLLTGELEPTNEWYAIAKIAGIKMCQAYRRQYDFNAICCMPTNLYGPGDNFHLEKSHVIPALIHKFHLAKVHNDPTVTLWGTGAPYREFLYVDDMADACILLLKKYNDPAIINVGFGVDISIAELAEQVKKVTGYQGKIVFDASKPAGPPRKLLETSKIMELGWEPKISLEEGLTLSYYWFKGNYLNSFFRK